MSILQLLLVLIVLPGMYRVYSKISGFFLNHPKLHLQQNARKIAFVFVVVTAALFATPLMTLGLPAFVRLFAWGIYLLYVVTGALYVWDGIQALGRRGSGPGK
jgi:hypothetical protein